MTPEEDSRLAALYSLQQIDTPRDPSLDKLTRIIKLACDTQMAAISLIDRDVQWLRSRYGIDLKRTPRSSAFCNHTIHLRETLVIEDASRDPRTINNPLVTGPPYLRSYAGAPLMTEDGHAIGAACALDTHPRTFTPNQLSILEHTAQLTMYHFELLLRAQTDHLTGALNRRGFEEELERELLRLTRHKGAALLIFIDIDHFKPLNDTFGHGAGDQILKAFGTTVRNTIRRSDIFARLGGDEFAILMPDTSTDDNLSAVWRVKEKIDTLRISDHPGLGITTSMGIAPVTSEMSGLSPDTLLAAADTALYHAKRKGRNACVVLTPDEVTSRNEDDLHEHLER